MGEVVPRYTCSLDSHVIHEKKVSLSDMSSGKKTWYDKYQNPTVLDASTQNFPTPRRNPSQKTMVFSNPKISPIQGNTPIVSWLFQRSTAFQLQLRKIPSRKVPQQQLTPAMAWDQDLLWNRLDHHQLCRKSRWKCCWFFEHLLVKALGSREIGWFFLQFWGFQLTKYYSTWN